MSTNERPKGDCLMASQDSNLRCKRDSRQKDVRVWKHQGTACLFHVVNVLPVIVDIIRNKT